MRSSRGVGSENVSSNQGLVLVVRVMRILQKKGRSGVKILVHKFPQTRKSYFRKTALQKNRKGTTVASSDQTMTNPQVRFHLPYKVYLHLHGKQRTGKRNYV